MLKRPVLFARDWVRSAGRYTFGYGESEPDSLIEPRPDRSLNYSRSRLRFGSSTLADSRALCVLGKNAISTRTRADAGKKTSA